MYVPNRIGPIVDVASHNMETRRLHGVIIERIPETKHQVRAVATNAAVLVVAEWDEIDQWNRVFLFPDKLNDPKPKRVGKQVRVQVAEWRRMFDAHYFEPVLLDMRERSGEQYECFRYIKGEGTELVTGQRIAKGPKVLWEKVIPEYTGENSQTAMYDFQKLGKLMALLTELTGKQNGYVTMLRVQGFALRLRCVGELGISATAYLMPMRETNPEED